MKKYNKWATLLGGWFGLHRYMAGEIGMGLLYTFTAGLFYIGWIVDTIKAFSYGTNVNTISNDEKFVFNKCLNFLFPLPSIILLLFGILLSVFLTNSDNTPASLEDKIAFIICFFIFIILPVDILILISKKIIKSFKKLTQKSSRKTITPQEAQLIQSKLERCKELADITNTTVNRIDFFLSLEELKKHLVDLCQYEGRATFNISPSQQLEIIRENEEKTIALLEERIKNSIETSQPPNKQNEKNFDSMEGHEFEYFCAELLKKNGFTDVEVTKGSGDHGIDIIAYNEDVKYGIQCKCYTGNIGNKAVQEAYTGKSFYDCDVAIVLTNRYFTSSAKEEAQKTRVKLWDRDKLNALINNVN